MEDILLYSITPDLADLNAILIRSAANATMPWSESRKVYFFQRHPDKISGKCDN